MVTKEEALSWLRQLNAYEEKMMELWSKKFKKELWESDLPKDVKQELKQLADTMVHDTSNHEQEFEEIKKYIEEGSGEY